MKPEIQALIDKAKNEFDPEDSGYITDGKNTVVFDNSKKQDSDDPYNQPDDRYGGIEDKW